MSLRNTFSVTSEAVAATISATGGSLSAALQLGESFITEELTKARVRNIETRNAWSVELVAEVRQREAKALEKIKLLGLTQEQIQSDVDRILANFNQD